MDDVLCQFCNNCVWDDDDETYYCDVEMDEDEFAHVMLADRRVCPFYQSNNEYEVVKHQM